MNEKAKELFSDILEMQRPYLTQLNDDQKVDEGVIRQQLHQLYLQEQRLKIIYQTRMSSSKTFFVTGH